MSRYRKIFNAIALLAGLAAVICGAWLCWKMDRVPFFGQFRTPGHAIGGWGIVCGVFLAPLLLFLCGFRLQKREAMPSMKRLLLPTLMTVLIMFFAVITYNTFSETLLLWAVAPVMFCLMLIDRIPGFLSFPNWLVLFILILMAWEYCYLLCRWLGRYWICWDWERDEKEK